MRRVSNIVMVFSCLFITVPFFSLAENPSLGWGRVNMQGSIVDTACAIAVDSRDQTIYMDIVPVADIIRDGHGGKKNFTIELSNCELERSNHKFPDWKHFQVTFDGASQGDLFEIQGAASGVALQIRDVTGNVARPGKPLPLVNITPGSMTLNYTIKLVANNHALKAGEYFSSVRFKLDYF